MRENVYWKIKEQQNQAGKVTYKTQKISEHASNHATHVQPQTYTHKHIHIHTRAHQLSHT